MLTGNEVRSKFIEFFKDKIGLVLGIILVLTVANLNLVVQLF